jgi:hypothetical protein
VAKDAQDVRTLGAPRSPRAGIVAFVSHPLPELRTALRGIRETAPPDSELAVVATGVGDQDATYLLRQYLRGRFCALEFVNSDAHGCHCGLDRVYRLVHGDYLARVDDESEFRPGWLELAVAALEQDPTLGCVSLVPPSDYHRGRGRPRTVNIAPVEVDRLDMRCFVAPRDLVERHGCELMSDQATEAESCRFQEVLRAEGRRLAFLPNQVTPLGAVDLASSGHDSWTVEAELPPHESAGGAMQQLEQAYHLGDDVLLTCLSCGGTELETLAARIRFCERHQVPIGFWYELRCPECGELHYKDDYQFRCPD